MDLPDDGLKLQSQVNMTEYMYLITEIMERLQILMKKRKYTLSHLITEKKSDVNMAILKLIIMILFQCGEQCGALEIVVMIGG